MLQQECSLHHVIDFGGVHVKLKSESSPALCRTPLCLGIVYPVALSAGALCFVNRQNVRQSMYIRHRTYFTIARSRSKLRTVRAADN